MSRPAFGTDRVPVPLSAVPAARAWAAFCLAVGGVVLALALGLAIGERARALKGPLIEALLAPMVLPGAPATP